MFLELRDATRHYLIQGIKKNGAPKGQPLQVKEVFQSSLFDGTRRKNAHYEG